jgi:hypothetical protein
MDGVGNDVTAVKGSDVIEVKGNAGGASMGVGVARVGSPPTMTRGESRGSEGVTLREGEGLGLRPPLSPQICGEEGGP